MDTAISSPHSDRERASRWRRRSQERCKRLAQVVIFAPANFFGARHGAVVHGPDPLVFIFGHGQRRAEQCASRQRQGAECRAVVPESDRRSVSELRSRGSVRFAACFEPGGAPRSHGHDLTSPTCPHRAATHARDSHIPVVRARPRHRSNAARSTRPRSGPPAQDYAALSRRLRAKLRNPRRG